LNKIVWSIKTLLCENGCN